jgi:hypothetical protein
MYTRLRRMWHVLSQYLSKYMARNAVNIYQIIRHVPQSISTEIYGTYYSQYLAKYMLRNTLHIYQTIWHVKGKGFPLQAWSGSWGSRRLRLLELLDFRRYEGDKVVTLTHRPSLPPGVFLVLIFRGWVDPRAHCSVGSLGKKFPSTQLGIDPETCRVVAQCLNYATPGPKWHVPQSIYTEVYGTYHSQYLPKYMARTTVNICQTIWHVLQSVSTEVHGT